MNSTSTLSPLRPSHASPFRICIFAYNVAGAWKSRCDLLLSANASDGWGIQQLIATEGGCLVPHLMLLPAAWLRFCASDGITANYHGNTSACWAERRTYFFFNGSVLYQYSGRPKLAHYSQADTGFGPDQWARERMRNGAFARDSDGLWAHRSCATLQHEGGCSPAHCSRWDAHLVSSQLLTRALLWFSHSVGLVSAITL